MEYYRIGELTYRKMRPSRGVVHLAEVSPGCTGNRFMVCGAKTDGTPVDVSSVDGPITCKNCIRTLQKTMDNCNELLDEAGF